jgi:circadian clock protein KaiB
LTIYIAGRTPRALIALKNLEHICRKYPKYTIRVIDIQEHPELAVADQILAIPTVVVNELPKPIRKLIGDLSNIRSVLIGLELKP